MVASVLWMQIFSWMSMQGKQINQNMHVHYNTNQNISQAFLLDNCLVQYYNSFVAPVTPCLVAPVTPCLVALVTPTFLRGNI